MSRKSNRRPAQSRPPAAQSPNLAWVAIPVMLLVIGGVVWAIASGAFRPDPARRNLLQNGTNQPAAETVFIPPVITPPVTVTTKPTGEPEKEFGDTEKSALRQNHASELLKEGKFKEAVAEYEAAVKLTPEDEDAHYNLAFALAKAGDREAARKEYEEALRIYADYTEAHNNLGNLLLADGKIEEAVTHFKAALQQSADDPLTQNNLGHGLALQGKTAEAVPCFKEALRLKPDYLEARQNLGVSYLQSQKYQEAIAEFKEVLRTKPDFEPALKGLARAQKLIGP